MPDLRYSDGIAAARTLIALEAEASALQRRLPSGWELAPYAGDDLRGASLQGANMLVPFHEVYAVRTRDGRLTAIELHRLPSIVRWYQEDQAMNVVRSDPLNVNRVSELSLNVKGELEDVFDGNERVVAVVIQRPYVRQVYVP